MFRPCHEIQKTFPQTQLKVLQFGKQICLFKILFFSCGRRVDVDASLLSGHKCFIETDDETETETEPII